MNSKLVFLVLAFLSILLAIRLVTYFASINYYADDQVITFETQLQSQPKISARGQRVSLILPNSQRITVLLTLNPLLSYGDKIKIEGKVEYFQVENGNQIASMNYPQFRVLKKGTETNLMYKVRENIINFFNSSFNPRYSSLMLGIVFGIKQEMDSQFYLDLQKVGLLHVIAASGMNITMVGGFFLGLFSLIFKRQLAIILSILGILLYAFMAGFEPSIVRASIMGILVFSAQLIGRQSSGFLGLFGAAFVMLFLNPSLVFDIGFQLSFMATLGLIYLRPIFFLNKKIKKVIKKSIIGEDLVTTTTAQLFTLPILLVNFGSYSLVSILVNGLVLWTVPILMAIGGLASILGLIIEPIGRALSYLSLPFLLYFEKIAELFSGFGGQFELKNLPVLIIFGYYCLLISIILFFRRKE